MLQEQLHRLERSRSFFRFDAQLRLLRFLLESASEEGQLRETDIAVRFYGRPEDYDSRKDSIVRVSINRLRQRLTDYYDAEGKQDLLHIAIPKGSYTPILIAIESQSGKRNYMLTTWQFWMLVAVVLLAIAEGIWIYIVKTVSRA